MLIVTVCEIIFIIEHLQGYDTLSAQGPAGSGEKVISIVLKYGYDLPDSFAKAFQRFNGITPSQARETGATLRCTLKDHWRAVIC